MLIRKTDGVPVWVKKYQMRGPYNGSNSFILRALVTDGRYIYMSGISQNENVLLKISADGSVVLAKRTPAGSVSLGWMGLKTGGRLLTSVSSYSAGGYVNGVVEMDTNFAILRSQFMKVPRNGRNGALIPFSDSVTYSAGSLWHENPYWASLYFQKYNFNSSFASCAVDDLLLSFNNFQQTVTAKQVSEVTLTPPQTMPLNIFYETAHLAYSGYYCGNNTNCSKLEINGPALICDTATTYSFNAKLNNDCKGNVLWQMDTVAGQLKIVLMTDTLVKVQVRKSGSFSLRGKVFANCGWLEDTITVQASISKAILDLGEDTTICAGNSYVLHAGAGFGSYLWQDGSTDSVFVVKQRGKYSVKVTSCGNTLTDSVFVRAAPPISFDAGPDRTKCNADTLHLTAPAGFLNYSWSNNYKISSLSSSTVIVNPLVDTSYFVKAEKTPGCYVYDTVRITVNTSPSIDLGRDTSFCTGDSMVLRAANGFQTYEWNNGSKSHQLAVRTTGSYSVIGTTSQGCKSFDTLKITEVFALPLVSLNKTPGLCMGESRTLDAGSFISYLWQDGSKGKTFMIRDTGRYYVKVTDKNGCKGGDTVIIKSLFSLPEKFLPADTFLCSYEKLELKSRLNYKDYLWNTGGNKPSIIVTQPGTYWLQVYDSNNCKGNISVTIRSKDCMVGFYVPSAFTPNGDGKNDLFRPLLYGNVKKYTFTIYNRMGQVVFQTSEMQNGWDGKIGGLPHQTSTFVWVCSYQLEGGEVKQEKGTVTLIR
jgi:gliding motility-associated-like protein